MRIAGWTPRASSRSSETATCSSATAPVRTRSHVRVDPAAEPALGRAQIERERDEPLLGAVVDVPLDPAPLLVARGDDAPARLLHLHELRAHLGVQTRVLQREPRRRRGGLEKLRLVVERPVVDDHRDPLAAVRDLGDRPRRTRLGELDRRACAST